MSTFWEARTGRGSTAVYIQGTNHAVAVGCTKEDGALIAAAPAMRDALADVLASFDYVLDDADHPDRAAMLACKAALTQVRGER